MNKQVCQYAIFHYPDKMKSISEPIRRILSNNLKKHREILGYTQEKLAEKTGLSTQTLNDIEGCRRWVSSKTLSKLAKTLKVNEYQLLLPEKEADKQKSSNSSLKSIIALKKNIRACIDEQFENAIDTGNFS